MVPPTIFVSGGIAVLQLCKEVYLRYQSVKRFRDDCKRLCAFVARIEAFLVETEEGADMTAPGWQAAFAALHESLLEVVEVFEDCARLGIVRSIINADDINLRLSTIAQRLTMALQLIPIQKAKLMDGRLTELAALQADIRAATFSVAEAAVAQGAQLKLLMDQSRCDADRTQDMLAQVLLLLQAEPGRAAGAAAAAAAGSSAGPGGGSGGGGSCAPHAGEQGAEQAAAVPLRLSAQVLSAEVEDLKAEMQRDKQAQEDKYLAQVVAAIEALEAALAPGAAQGADEEPPETLRDPITWELLRDPIILLESNNTYERASIEEWFARGNSKEPLNGVELSCKQFVPNLAVRHLASDWLDAHPAYRQRSEQQAAAAAAHDAAHLAGGLGRSASAGREAALAKPRLQAAAHAVKSRCQLELEQEQAEVEARWQGGGEGGEALFSPTPATSALLAVVAAHSKGAGGGGGGGAPAACDAGLLAAAGLDAEGGDGSCVEHLAHAPHEEADVAAQKAAALQAYAAAVASAAAAGAGGGAPLAAYPVLLRGGEGWGDARHGPVPGRCLQPGGPAPTGGGSAACAGRGSFDFPRLQAPSSTGECLGLGGSLQQGEPALPAACGISSPLPSLASGSHAGSSGGGAALAATSHRGSHAGSSGGLLAGVSPESARHLSPLRCGRSSSPALGAAAAAAASGGASSSAEAQAAALLAPAGDGEVSLLHFRRTFNRASELRGSITQRHGSKAEQAAWQSQQARRQEAAAHAKELAQAAYLHQHMQELLASSSSASSSHSAAQQMQQQLLQQQHPPPGAAAPADVARLQDAPSSSQRTGELQQRSWSTHGSLTPWEVTQAGQAAAWSRSQQHAQVLEASGQEVWLPGASQQLGSVRRSQEMRPGCASQEQLGPLRASHGQLGPLRTSQEQLGPLRASHGQLGPPRASQEQLGPLRASQEQLGPLRASQEDWLAHDSQELPVHGLSLEEHPSSTHSWQPGAAPLSRHGSAAGPASSAASFGSVRGSHSSHSGPHAQRPPVQAPHHDQLAPPLAHQGSTSSVGSASTLTLAPRPGAAPASSSGGSMWGFRRRSRDAGGASSKPGSASRAQGQGQGQGGDDDAASVSSAGSGAASLASSRSSASKVKGFLASMRHSLVYDDEKC